VSNSSLNAHNLKAFIPTYKVLRSGIVRDVPQDVTAELLRDSISSPIKVLEIHRLNRRLKLDNEVNYVPSCTICLKFAGQILPRFIYLFNCRYSVYPFIPKTRICFSCFRVGHLNKTCKSRPRCLYCGETVHDSSEVYSLKQAPPKCINCKGDHLATSHDCPRVMTHKMALSMAATENIPFADALRSVGSSLPSSHTSISDPRLDFFNFPPLSRHRSSRSPPNFFALNNFAVLSGLSSSGDSSIPSSSYSSTLKNPTLSAPRPIRDPRFKQSSPPFSSSSPPTPNNHHNSNHTPAFPREHRYLLISPHGRLAPIEHTGAYRSPFSPFPDSSGCPVPSETQAQLDEIYRLLSNSEILQHLLVTLRGITPSLNINQNINPAVLPTTFRPPPSSYDLQSFSSWARGSPSQP